MLASTREEEMHPIMGFGQCVQKNNLNSRHRQKAQTLQPGGNMFLLQKYFDSANAPWVQPTTYANVPNHEDDPLSPISHQQHQTHHNHHHQRQQSRHSHRSHHHQHLHARSHSQHYYQPMLTQGLNDLNCYYNVVPPGITRSRHSPSNEPPRPIHTHPGQLDCITLMQVCNELGNNIDSAPPMPSSRKYTISRTQGETFKVALPQKRIMNVDFCDQFTGTSIKAGESISVLEPSNDDRSKFTICYDHKYIDLPHQYTQAPQVHLNLGYNHGFINPQNISMRHYMNDQHHMTNALK